MNNLKNKPWDWWISVTIIALIFIFSMVLSWPKVYEVVLIFGTSAVVFTCLFRVIKDYWPVSIIDGKVRWNF